MAADKDSASTSNGNSDSSMASEGVLLALLTAAAYSLSSMYHGAYLAYFGFSSEVTCFSVGEIVQTGLISAVVIGPYLIGHWLRAGTSRIEHIIGGTLVFGALPSFTSLLFSNNLRSGMMIVGVILLVLLALHLWPFFKPSDKSYYVWLSEDVGKFASPRYMIGMLVMSFFLGFIQMDEIAVKRARAKKEFQTTTIGASEYAVIKTCPDRAFLASFDRTSERFTNHLKIVELPSSELVFRPEIFTRMSTTTATTARR